VLSVGLDRIARASDVQATRAAYAGFKPWACDCSYCRNFRLQMNRIPEQIWLLLQKMGIDAEKPNEIVEYGGCDGGGRLYEIEWPFLAVGDAALVDHYKVECEGCEITVYRGGIPCSVFDAVPRRCSVSIMMSNVPWVLAEPEPHS